jgi:diguanylate cyclase (GGDEF)-like protein
VVRINLDQFKRINDSIGHGAGDALLQAVASRLGTFLKLERDGAVTMPLARLTGDEFAVAIRHLQSDADVQSAINNIMAAFASPFLIRHRDFFVTCTIGIAIFPDHGSFATSCCAPRAWRCTRPRPRAATAASSTANTCARVRWRA